MTQEVEPTTSSALPVLYPEPLFACATQEIRFGVIRIPEARMRTLRIANVGGEGALHVTLEPNLTGQTWFTVKPPQLSIPAGEHRIVDVMIDASQPGCPTGIQSVDVKVDAVNSVVPPPDRIPVHVEILEEIDLVAEPAEIDFGDVSKGEGRTLSCIIARSDGGDVQLDERMIRVIDANGQRRNAWIDVQVGRPGREQRLELTFHTVNRAEREYTCRLQLTDLKPEVNPLEIPVRIRVTPPPQLDLHWAVEPLPLFTGGTQECGLAVRNAGGGVLRGRIFGDQRWLRASPSEFQVESLEVQTVTVTIGDPRLIPGEYRGSLDIHSNDGGRARRRRLTLDLTVFPPDAKPIQSRWEADVIRLTKGERATRTLTVTNPVGQVFRGALRAEGGNWLQPSVSELELQPGERQRIPVDIVTDRLPSPKEVSEHPGRLIIASADGDTVFTHDCTLQLLPAPKRWWLWALLAAAALAAMLYFGRNLLPHPDANAPAATTAQTAPQTPEQPPAQPPASRPSSPPAPAADAERETAERRDPEAARRHYENGMALKRRDRFALARDELEQAVALDPDNADYHWALAWVHRSLNETDKAVDEFRAVIRLDPDSQHARESQSAILRMGESGAR